MEVGKVRAGEALLCALLILSLTGCGGRRAAVREEPSLPDTTGPRVAVAPMENRSNDINASEIIRSAFVGAIARKGWNVVPTEESDRMLRESLGITYGGQLASTTPGEVCRNLGVDGVFYGEIREWNKTTTGIYNNVTVTASFELYDRDGTPVWQGSDTQSKALVPHGGREIGAEIVVNALGNLLLNPMTPYGRSVARNIAGKLPGGLLEGYEPAPAQDNTTREAVTPTEGGGTR
ncbi:MAG: GNA1162 family protein [Candidatus Deferrimicrobiaceae bacterium]